MRIIQIDLEQIRKCEIPMCACIGYFDGLHKGHQALVSRTLKLSQKYGCESALITFDTDPSAVIRGLKEVRHITTMKQRIAKAEALGIRNIILLRFTKAMSELDPDVFIRQILGSLTLKGLVCGFDFHYGYKGKGNPLTLQASCDYEVAVVEAVEDEKGKISSTRICDCIERGDMEEAESMLGEPFAIDGIVIHGKKRGTGMGFPTANVSVSDEYLIPERGVYAGLAVFDDQQYPAMINIGINPTFGDLEHISLEAHLIGFSGDLYGTAMSIRFKKFIRPETKFRNEQELIGQLTKDKKTVSDYFGVNHE